MKKIFFSKKNIFGTLVFLAVIWGGFFSFVDLKPQITPDFFFSKDSKIFKKNERVKEKFPFNGNQVLLGLPHKNILSESYLARIKRISERLLKMKEVKRVVSLSHGPQDPSDALKNPLWKRIITGGKTDVTFISVYLGKKGHSKVIKVMEEIIHAYGKVGIPIRIAGIPYFVEQMKRNLQHDMTRFLLASVILCSLTLFIIHRSFFLVALSILCSLSSAALSLLVLQLFGQGIGILTANLMVIAYVLAQSHFIFYSANYKRVLDSKKAFMKTMPASFWSMATTLLGFIGLIFVEAKPLVELGYGGVIASLCAFATSYLILPSAINYYKPSESEVGERKGSSLLRSLYKSPRKLGFYASTLFVSFAVIVALFGLPAIDTDPSLLRYFKGDGEIFKQLSFLNDRGGSNVLRLVLKRKNGAVLDNDKSYKELWDLQEKLKKHQQVGTIISLPVIMKEADQHWLGQFLSWDWTVDLLTSDTFDRMGNGFISEDRKETAYILKMIEAREGRVNRLEVVKELKTIVQQSPFQWVNPAGSYYLQGELAQSVRDSLIKGVSGLIGVLFLVLLWVSGSFTVSLAVSFFLSLLVLMIFGVMGLARVPMDLISSPAISIALGIAIDSLIHLIRAVKSFGKEVEGPWQRGLRHQGEAILTSGFTVIIGFSVFLLSSFPPSQRFGGLILAGTLLALPITLIIIPSIFKRQETLA